MLVCQLDDPPPKAHHHCISSHQKSSNPPMRQSRKCRVELALAGCIHDMQLQSQCTSRVLKVSNSGRKGRIGRIKQTDLNGSGKQFPKISICLGGSNPVNWFTPVKLPPGR